MNSLSIALNYAYVPVGGGSLAEWQPWIGREVRLQAERLTIAAILAVWLCLGVLTAAVYPRLYPMSRLMVMSDPDGDTGSSVQQDVSDCVATGRSLDFCRSIYVVTGKEGKH